MEPNHSFLRFIKYMMRDSPKVIYIKHLLSSSSSLKNKGVLIHRGGGNLKRVSQCVYVFFGNSPSSHLRTLHLSLHLCNLVGGSIAFEPFHSYEFLSSHNWFLVQSSTKNVMSLIASMLPSQFFLSCLSVRRLSSQSPPFLVLYTQFHQLYLCQSCSFDLLISSYSCFVSLMGEPLLPSFDKSSPIDFNTSSGNQPKKPFGTLEPACLNGRSPCFWQLVYIIDLW